MSSRSSATGSAEIFSGDSNARHAGLLRILPTLRIHKQILDDARVWRTHKQILDDARVWRTCKKKLTISAAGWRRFALCSWKMKPYSTTRATSMDTDTDIFFFLFLWKRTSFQNNHNAVGYVKPPIPAFMVPQSSRQRAEHEIIISTFLLDKKKLPNHFCKVF